MVTFWDGTDQVVLNEFELYLKKHAVHIKKRRINNNYYNLIWNFQIWSQILNKSKIS